MIRVGIGHARACVCLLNIGESVAVRVFVAIVDSVCVGVLRERVIAQIVQFLPVSEAVVVCVRVFRVSAELSFE